MELLDRKKMGIVQGIALSFLNQEEQDWILDIIVDEKVQISTKAAELCKECAQSGTLTQEKAKEFLLDSQKKKSDALSINRNRLKSYFPSSYSNEDIEKVIFQLLEEWQQRTGGGEVGQGRSI